MAAAVLALAGTVQAIAVNLATSAVPDGWWWLHDTRILWPTIIGLTVLAVGLAVYMAREPVTTRGTGKDADGTVNVSGLTIRTMSIESGSTVNINVASSETVAPKEATYQTRPSERYCHNLSSPPTAWSTPSTRPPRLTVKNNADAASQKLYEARQIINLLGFKMTSSSRLPEVTLLALCGLTPNSQWRVAQRPTIQARQILVWSRDVYGCKYAENSREVIRRTALREFLKSGLVLLNEDDLHRPVNSARTSYQLSIPALHLISKYGEKEFAEQASEWRSARDAEQCTS